MGRKNKKNRTWNKKYLYLRMACWNPWGLCNERMNYCRVMDFDILGLTELHNNIQNKKLWQKRYWVTSADAEVDQQGICTDPAAGVDSRTNIEKTHHVHKE